MDLVRLKLLTIVAEAVLEPLLLDDLRDLGARGYSVGQVRGEGSRGLRASEWEGSNIRIETVVAEATAERILARIAERYFAHYAVIAYVADVQVVRGDKYV